MGIRDTKWGKEFKVWAKKRPVKNRPVIEGEFKWFQNKLDEYEAQLQKAEAALEDIRCNSLEEFAVKRGDKYFKDKAS